MSDKKLFSEDQRNKILDFKFTYKDLNTQTLFSILSNIPGELIYKGKIYSFIMDKHENVMGYFINYNQKNEEYIYKIAIIKNNIVDPLIYITQWLLREHII